MDNDIYEEHFPVTIGKVYTFDAAHQLPGHKGKCRNLHGHTYQVEVSIKGMTNPETGMLMDYDELDRIMKPIIEAMDHSTLLTGFETFGAEHLTTKIYTLRSRFSTAENIASEILELFCNNTEDNPNIQEVTVTVRETPKTFARVVMGYGE